jgi:putative membrane protein
MMAIVHAMGGWCTPGSWHGAWHGAWNGPGTGWFGFFPFHLGPLLQIALIAMLAYVIFRRFRTPAVQTPAPEVQRQDTPRDILNRRYALGEIDKDTFESMKEDLQ